MELTLDTNPLLSGSSSQSTIEDEATQRSVAPFDTRSEPDAAEPAVDESCLSPGTQDAGSLLQPPARSSQQSRSNTDKLLGRPILPNMTSQNKKSVNVLRNALSHGTVAPGQPFPSRRGKDKILPLELSKSGILPEGTLLEEEEDTVEEEDVTAFCIAYELDISSLKASLVERFGVGVYSFPEDVNPGQTADIIFAKFIGEDGALCGDIVYFEFGVIVTWGLSSGQQYEAVFQLAGQHATQPLSEADVEVDEVKMQYSTGRPTQVQNDVVCLSKKYRDDMQMKISVSIALAQSTRISVHEAQVVEIVYETKDLPNQLAESGRVELTHEKLAQLIGCVFLQKSALNLQVLSGQGETPKFFWGRSDILGQVYKTLSSYLEMEERIDVLNSRFQVLTDMLDLLRDQQVNAHGVHLEWIVIILIMITLGLGMLQIASLLGSRVHVPVTLGKLMAASIQSIFQAVHSDHMDNDYDDAYD